MPVTHLHDDLTIHHLGLADPAAPTLVLMHGLTDSGPCWADAVARWSSSYRILAWDARGHGRSARFDGGRLATGVGETHLADAVSLLEWLVSSGASAPVLVGHSMGGGTAADVAGERPDLVRAVLLEDPALGRFPEQSPDSAVGARRVAELRAIADDPETALTTCRRDNPRWPPSELEPWLEAKLQTDLAMLADPVVTVRTPWAEVAEKVAVPALVVTGTDGVIWSGDGLAQLRAVSNPHLEVHVVDGAEHCVRRTATQAFHALADPWLAAYSS